MPDDISYVIITHKIISYALSATPYLQKKKAGRNSAGLFMSATR